MKNKYIYNDNIYVYTLDTANKTGHLYIFSSHVHRIVCVIYRRPQTTVSHDFTIFITRSLTSKFPTGINHCFTSTKHKNPRLLYVCMYVHVYIYLCIYTYIFLCMCTNLDGCFYLRIYSLFSFPRFFFFFFLASSRRRRCFFTHI